jgi:hypothetical protein
VAKGRDESNGKSNNDRDQCIAEEGDHGKRYPDNRGDRGSAGELEDNRVLMEDAFRRDRKERQGHQGQRRVQEIVLAKTCRHLRPEVEHDAGPAGKSGMLLPVKKEQSRREECTQDEEIAHDGCGKLFCAERVTCPRMSARVGGMTQPVRPEKIRERFCPSLLPFCTVVPALVAAIAPVRPGPDTGGLALLADRAVVFYLDGLLFLFHGD